MEPSPGASPPPEWRRGIDRTSGNDAAAPSFGALLRELRDGSGLSQQDLAARAGRTPSHISRLESGERGPSREVVDALAAALGASARDRLRLLRAAGLVEPLDPLLEALAELLRSEDLPAEARARLCALLEIAVAYGRSATGGQAGE